MATVRIQSPVAVSHPITQQFITLSKGQEFDDNDPIVKEFGWAFADDAAVEQASAAPGEKRSTKRG